jgi:septum formation inhibitor-activating ATPase MinD
MVRSSRKTRTQRQRAGSTAHLLAAHFRYVVVIARQTGSDCATALRSFQRRPLVAQADVVSLWSASRIRTFLEEGATRDRVRIVLNRYKKIPGFTDEDVEKTTQCKVLWKVPNSFQAISPSIDHGTPVVLQENQEVSRQLQAVRQAMVDDWWVARQNGEQVVMLAVRRSDRGGDSSKKQPAYSLISPAGKPVVWSL